MKSHDETNSDEEQRIRYADVIFINSELIWGADFLRRIIDTGETKNLIIFYTGARPEDAPGLIQKVIRIKTAQGN